MGLLPDLIVKKAKIVTMNKDQPEAEAFCVWGGRIVAIGSNETISKEFPKAKKVLELEGQFICPGFNDTHTHLLAYAVKLKDIHLESVQSIQEALELVEKRANETPKGAWLFGEGWDESNWKEKRYLTLKELDRVAPEHPCYIRRVCGHLVAVNTLALKELGISLNDPDLELDPETGKPTGILYDELINRLSKHPKLQRSQEAYIEAVKIACEYAHALGVTSVTDNLNLISFKAYQVAKRNGSLKLRIAMNIPQKHFPVFLDLGFRTGLGDEFLRLEGVKIFTDGSLGSRTAALSEEYFDSATTGEMYITEAEYQDLLKKAMAHGWQTATHAIGDRAIEFILQAFERFNNAEAVRKGRHRIEHAEYLTDAQLARANKLGLILSMQPNFPGRWGKPGQLYEQRLGPERYKLLNNFNKIFKTNALVSFGSDNMPMSPLFGIWSIVTHPLEDIRVNLDEALYHYTLAGAYTTFEEDIKGSLEVGKVADFVILDKDLYSIKPETIKNVQVLATFINGELVYSKEGFFNMNFSSC
ncbi:hypothetical protein DRO91_05340 [Candidatus Heimdallarchaeota archaeon]|nr:MAG: hypothetical protein DRO63_05595 [Candidatus Gerdarchaeota archaeon]RLI68868.1 MAG: hypothetical protein DRP02_11720 [Candidatus Gerdarchaeota archaeon]RLI71725.1 MAG: hypothetical protein DRO91_05340 [Candidatus Heimdallarchaeota archaeon]